jgi:hypothetical protein
MMPLNKEQRQRLEALLELAHDVGDTPDHFVGGLDDSTPLWKLYLRKHIALSIRVKVDMLRQRASHYFFAEFEALATGVKGHGNRISNLTERGLALEAAPRSHEHRVNDAVFVSVGEVSKNGEGVLTPVPSIVRLKQLNHCPVPRRHLAQAAGLGKISALNAGNTFISDGKLDFLNVTGHSSPGVVKRKLPDKVVLSTSQIMNEVSNYETRSTQECFGYFCDVEDVLSCIRVDIGANSYRVSFSPDDRFDFGLQGIVVLDCPVDFGLDAAEVGSVGHD